MYPLVSICISYYNYRDYWYECLKSCVNQTYPNVEVVVVDDFSYPPLVAKDGLCSRYTMDYHTVPVYHYLHKENKGYSSAKNTAIRNAHGDYICLLDADDVLTPYSIEMRMKVFFAKPELDLVHCQAERFYGYKNGKPDLRGVNPKTYVHAQGRMYKRSVYERFGLYYEPLRSMSDKEFVYRIGVHPNSPFKKKIKEKRIKKVGVWYRKHEKQMHRTRKQDKQKNNSIRKVFQVRIDQLKREGITRENTVFL